MSYQYIWKNKEANFGKPLRRQVRGGTHITFELVLKWKGRYVGLRRPRGIPGHELPPRAGRHPSGLLYFCHNLIRYGESVDQCIRRIVKFQTGVGVKSWRIVDIDAEVQAKDGQWAFMPYAIIELARKPKVGKHGNKIVEAIEFTKRNIPTDFGWWSKGDLTGFLKKFD